MSAGLRALIVEGARVARSGRSATVAIAGICAASVLLVSMVSAGAVEQERAVLDRVGSSESLAIVATDSARTGLIRPDLVSILCGLSTVDAALALGPAADVHNAFLPDDAPGVPVRSAVGSWVTDGRSGCGQVAGSGVWLSSRAVRRLGFGDVLRSVEDRRLQRVGVAGTTTFTGVFVDLASGGVRVDPSAGEHGDEQLIRLVVIVRSTNDASAVAAFLRHHFDKSGGGVTVSDSEGLIRLRSAIAGELTRSSRRTVAGGLVASWLLVGAMVSFTVANRARDLGRRRALGATRRDIWVVVVATTTWQAGAGAIIGCSAAWATSWPAHTGFFSLQLGILVMCAAVLGASGPALLAANRDPVRVLRSP